MFSWFELQTTDIAAAKKFYSGLFGWKTEEMNMPGMEYTLVLVGGEQSGGITGLPPQAKGMPPFWGIYATVSDVDATVKQAQHLGGAVVVPPMDIPKVGRFAVIRDPQGTVLSVIASVKM